MPRQSIELPDTVKKGLDKMATAFGMTQNALISLAVATMVVKYEAEVNISLWQSHQYAQY